MWSSIAYFAPDSAFELYFHQDRGKTFRSSRVPAMGPSILQLIRYLKLYWSCHGPVPQASGIPRLRRAKPSLPLPSNVQMNGTFRT